MPEKILIAALGNEIRADDGLPFYILDQISSKCNGIKCIKLCAAAFNLVDELKGYQIVIVLDTINLTAYPLGEVISKTYKLADLKDKTLRSHTTSLLTIMKLYEFLNEIVPEELYFILINIKENNIFKIGFSTDYEFVIDKVLSALNKILGSKCLGT